MKYINILTLMIIVLIFFSVNVVSASDLDFNNTNEVELTSYTIDSEIDKIDFAYDSDMQIEESNNVDLIKSENNNSRTIYIGQNTSDDGGNGSYENPYSSLKLACDNVNGEGIVNVYLFNGTYYVGSELKFNKHRVLVIDFLTRSI